MKINSFNKKTFSETFTEDILKSDQNAIDFLKSWTSPAVLANS